MSKKVFENSGIPDRSFLKAQLFKFHESFNKSFKRIKVKSSLKLFTLSQAA